MMPIYYVIETQYVGPDQDKKYLNTGHYYDIDTSPAITNSSHEERTEGWCGTTNDWAIYAHGQFATMEEARAKIDELVGDAGLREVESCDIDDEDTVERYLHGRLERWVAEGSEMFAWEKIKETMTASTSDDELEELVDEIMTIARYEVQAELDDRAILRAAEYRRAELAAEED